MFLVNLDLKGGFQLMQILGLLGMYFDAVVVGVKTFLLLFRLALAILCLNYRIKYFNVPRKAVNKIVEVIQFEHYPSQP